MPRILALFCMLAIELTTNMAHGQIISRSATRRLDAFDKKLEPMGLSHWTTSSTAVKDGVATIVAHVSRNKARDPAQLDRRGRDALQSLQEQLYRVMTSGITSSDRKHPRYGRAAAIHNALADTVRKWANDAHAAKRADDKRRAQASKSADAARHKLLGLNRKKAVMMQQHGRLVLFVATAEQYRSAKTLPHVNRSERAILDAVEHLKELRSGALNEYAALCREIAAAEDASDPAAAKKRAWAIAHGRSDCFADPEAIVVAYIENLVSLAPRRLAKKVSDERERFLADPDAKLTLVSWRKMQNKYADATRTYDRAFAAAARAVHGKAAADPWSGLYQAISDYQNAIKKRAGEPWDHTNNWQKVKRQYKITKRLLSKSIPDLAGLRGKVVKLAVYGGYGNWHIEKSALGVPIARQLKVDALMKLPGIKGWRGCFGIHGVLRQTYKGGGRYDSPFVRVEDTIAPRNCK